MVTRRKGNEFGDRANATGDGQRDSSGQHAIAAWESEGGGPAEARGGLDLARTALTDNAGCRASNNAERLANHSDKDTSKDDGAPALADEEDRILRCLGAAVIMRWNTLPTKLQRELFDNASSVGELLQAGTLKGQIARFLHKHKDDAG
jgi:hypothetical protein